MLGEEDAQPCQASKASIETVGFLTIVGHKAVSVLRQWAPSKERKPIARERERAMETLRDALVLGGGGPQRARARMHVRQW
jgi:hypothetical protein